MRRRYSSLPAERVAMEYVEEDGGEEDNINQEDCWEVISAYFEEKGLVRQQVAANLKTPSVPD